MIKYVLYKSCSVNPCEQADKCKLIDYLKGGNLRGPWVFDWCLQGCKGARWNVQARNRFFILNQEITVQKSFGFFARLFYLGRFFAASHAPCIMDHLSLSYNPLTFKV